METNKTILVIDDEATTLELLESTLSKSGYQVLTASSGEEGLMSLEKKHLLQLSLMF